MSSIRIDLRGVLRGGSRLSVDELAHIFESCLHMFLKKGEEAQTNVALQMFEDAYNNIELQLTDPFRRYANEWQTAVAVANAAPR